MLGENEAPSKDVASTWRGGIAARHQAENQGIVQRTKTSPDVREILGKRSWCPKEKRCQEDTQGLKPWVSAKVSRP
jgi:hypothetical protein